MTVYLSCLIADVEEDSGLCSWTLVGPMSYFDFKLSTLTMAKYQS